ncbi:MAG: HTTM domain-containing protein [Chitinophagaceae bacterium]|nr:HTTM domain-containing protein [Chitinophagaceae bacterium]
MFASLIRFWWRGWIGELYLKPSFHFTYLGFEWVKPLEGNGMYILYAAIIVAALFIMLGLFYRVATVTFFLGFTYAELIDATTYLNHYYFISLVSFLLIWVPANRKRSLDVMLKIAKPAEFVPSWTIGIIRFQMAVVYIFAGLAKLNYDWLIEAQPMRIWLPAKSHLPVIGGLLYKTWIAYFFSWFGAIYDLFIVFFLLNKKTRVVAYVFVIIFHGATAILFPAIGMFPYVMIACTLIFFPGRKQFGLPSAPVENFVVRKRIFTALAVYVTIQLLVPIRFLAYPGHLFWHEQGYRFSWRVMLMEKAGAAYFTVKEKETGRRFEVNNSEFLTPLQEKMMSTQPDMIVKYARYLAEIFAKRGVINPEVTGEIYVTLNGERSRLFIDSTVNLASQKVGWQNYQWVLPYKK